jgi:bifunctional dihydroflavonol 4-reductase/flavanone 4-reductase
MLGFQSESNAQYYERLKQLQCFIGSIVFVHTVDVCSAHIFLMEHPSAEGRYICSSQSFSLRELGDFCCKRYPQFNLPLK